MNLESHPYQNEAQKTRYATYPFEKYWKINARATACDVHRPKIPKQKIEIESANLTQPEIKATSWVSVGVPSWLRGES
ncbi:hypothetical protein [Pseudorhodobacter aquimaris]|uniref:hypothetical protein n=1 Tax=Pseudorhodobacter aquimaris TaxID=687412 RepID=UPI0012ED791D|nr:hypothetical protein [Pseudorhodobacter aquimaris]